ncbi:MAG: amino acid racemase [Eubacteriales bacterium]|nr:amino acid racemase [Eubacteriales bacterium]
MKKIGLVGGTGPESTLMYYKELNTKIDHLTNGNTMPDIVIESVNFRKAWEYVSSGNYDKLGGYLSEKVNLLKLAGAEIIALTAGTMHIVFDDIEKRTNVSLISIPQAVCEEALKRKYKKVGLLGTIFTMEQNYMKKDFVEAGIEIMVPSKEDRELVAKRIFEELEFGIVKDTTLQEFNAIIHKMQNDYRIEAVILGCTELPLLLNNENCVLPCMDSVEIHINKLIRLANMNS